MNLSEITAEIVALEKRLELLHAAKTALQALEDSTNPARVLVDIEDWKKDIPRATGIAASIREFLGKNGPATKADIETFLSGFRSLRKGTVSGALQAMKVSGAVTRTKAGKWTLK